MSEPPPKRVCPTGASSSSGSSKPARKDPMDTLSDMQKTAVCMALEGHSIFLTGAAGVGKSYTVKHMLVALRKAGKRVVVTASTGVGKSFFFGSNQNHITKRPNDLAAVSIGGGTIHSFAGIGIGAGAAGNSMIPYHHYVSMLTLCHSLAQQTSCWIG